MSIALENVTNCATRFIHGNGPPPGGSRFRPVDHRSSPDSCSHSSTSSIGDNSDDDSRGSTTGGDDSGNATEEVQSPYRGGGGGGSFSCMNALEEVLPIRRGISRFYNGKSKSFTSLMDTSNSSSVRDIAKPENAYTRRRRNLLATGLAWDKSHRSTCSPLRSNGAGPFKKTTTNFSRTKLALAISMGGPKTSCMNSATFSQQSHCQTHRNGDFSAYRSLSLADLEQFCTPDASSAQPEKRS